MPLKDDIELVEATVDHIRSFVKNAGDSLSTFRYFENRPFTIIEDHLKTIVALQKGQVVGYGHLDPEGDQVWLGIAVLDAFRGKGLGNLIMVALIESAKRSEIEEIVLSVDDGNTGAKRLYEKFGFNRTRKEGEVCFMKRVL